MKNRFARMISLWLAGALQVMPLIRSALPALSPGAAPSGWAIVFRWAAGAFVYLGFDAISSASTIAISPPNAIVGQPYVGTVTYSGGHSGSVSSMSLTNVCLGSLTPLFSGLSIVYNGGNTATVSGTPTAAGSLAFTLKVFDGSGCGGGGNTDTRTTSLVIGTGGSSGVAPAISTAPQSVTAQIGSDALLSAGASGTPPPQYYWYVGLPSVSTLVSTNSIVEFPTVQLTNAGLYTVVASNATATATAFAYLSVVLTPGTNQLALNFTNYYPQGHALTMYSYLTNAPSGSNVFKWRYNFVDVTAYSTSGNTLSLTPAQVTGSKSGIYAVVFNSVVGSTTVVNQQQYYSFWSFGTPPAVVTPPQGTNVSAGADVSFSVSASGSNTLSYQWVFNNTNILAGQTGTSLNLSAVQPSDSGSYSVVITNYYGSITSSPALLTVNSSGSPPGIAVEPVPVSVLVGQHAGFTVTASGTPPFSYQGRRMARTSPMAGCIPVR